MRWGKRTAKPSGKPHGGFKEGEKAESMPEVAPLGGGLDGERKTIAEDSVGVAVSQQAESSDLLSAVYGTGELPLDLPLGGTTCNQGVVAGVGTLEEEAMRFFSRADVDDNASTTKNTSATRERPLVEQLQTALALAEEHRHAHSRMVTEMQNFRNRSDRDNQQSRQFAIEGFARDLLLVADNLERALAAMPKESDAGFKAMQDGMILIQSELNRAFEKHGVTRIKALNEPFDPHLHQAVVHMEDAQARVGNVVKEMQTGYLLNGRLLRPAMVGVAKDVA